MKKFMNEFKTFAMKGNVIDLAVGIVIGGAFGKIVSSLVNDLLMPLLGLVSGRVNVAGLKYVILDAQNVEIFAVKYGAFLQSILDFVIIAFSIFVLIKAMNVFKKNEEEKPKAESKEPSKEEVLLTEIRDLLKEKN